MTIVSRKNLITNIRENRLEFLMHLAIHFWKLEESATNSLENYQIHIRQIYFSIAQIYFPSKWAQVLENFPRELSSLRTSLAKKKMK